MNAGCKNAIWVTLNNSTRSKQLSGKLGIPVKIYGIESPAIIRHGFAFFWSVGVLFKNRPAIIYTQYSFILQCAIFLYQLIFRKTIVIADFHNKALLRSVSLPILGQIHETVKRKTIKISRLGIVTNEYMLEPLRKYVAKTAILPDPLPDIKIQNDKSKLIDGNKVNVTYVSSFAVDEPHHLIYSVASRFVDSHVFYVTGRINNMNDVPEGLPQNIVFTDYLSDREYHSLVRDSDAVVCLTSEPEILQCAIYESIMLNSTIIVNESEINRSVFGDCLIYTELNEQNLSKAISQVGLHDKYQSISLFKKRYSEEFSDRIKGICPANILVGGQL